MSFLKTEKAQVVQTLVKLIDKQIEFHISCLFNATFANILALQE